MMIFIATIEQGACIALNAAGPPVRENSRRLSRAATLDGGCVISDNGVSASDRTFEYLAAQLDPASASALWSFFEDQDLVHLSCPEGVFAGYVSGLKIQAADASLSFMVYEKLA